MGFFSKNKKEDSGNNQDLGLPPLPESLGNSPNNSSQMRSNSLGDQVNSSNANINSDNSNSGINDIKNQITMPEPPQTNAGFDDLNSNLNDNFNSQELGASQESGQDKADSLFDFSDLDLPEEDDTKKENNIVENKDHQLKFIGNKKRNLDETKPFFVTTAQFKFILEVIEQVKSKVKDSSQRHLRLLDIKSEEEIEYENLKKDFIYIEDKLYEIDNFLFED